MFNGLGKYYEDGTILYDEQWRNNLSHGQGKILLYRWNN